MFFKIYMSLTIEKFVEVYFGSPILAFGNACLKKEKKNKKKKIKRFF